MTPELGIALFPHYARDAFIDLARAIDSDPAFSHLWVPDERFFRDLFVEMTLAAQATKRVKIGSAVTDPYIRHPAVTAVAMASVDEVADGRLIAGIGAGISGFDALSIRRIRPQATIRECVEVMRAIWHGQDVEFEGETTGFTGKVDFEPVRSQIPVWIAGRGPKILSLAGEIADGVFIGGLASKPGLDYAHDRIDRGLEQGGRDRDAIKRGLWLHTAVSEDGDAARDAVKAIVTGVLISSRSIIEDLGLEVPGKLMDALKGVTYGVNNPQMQAASALIDEETMSHFSVAGTPKEVAARLRALGEMGIDHVAVVPWLGEGQDLRGLLAALSEAGRL